MGFKIEIELNLNYCILISYKKRSLFTKPLFRTSKIALLSELESVLCNKQTYYNQMIEQNIVYTPITDSVIKCPQYNSEPIN